MRNAGMRVGRIAKFYHMVPSTDSNIIRRSKLESTTTTMQKRGRKLKLSVRSIRLFCKYVIENRFDPLHIIVDKFSSYTGIQIHQNTARSYIKKLQMASYVAIRKPFKTPNHLLARLQWARKHENWTHEQWKQVMFTDESSFTVRPMSNQLRVWRKWDRDGCRVAQFLLLNQNIKQLTYGAISLGSDGLLW